MNDYRESRLLAKLIHRIRWGSGSPEGVVAAPQGTIYLRADGAAATTLWVKTSGGSTSTGWTSK